MRSDNMDMFLLHQSVERQDGPGRKTIVLSDVQSDEIDAVLRHQDADFLAMAKAANSGTDKLPVIGFDKVQKLKLHAADFRILYYMKNINFVHMQTNLI